MGKVNMIMNKAFIVLVIFQVVMLVQQFKCICILDKKY